jgi:predicted flavoprotein YhiN
LVAHWECLGIAFNFQWAWSSGTVAGKAAGEKAVAEVADTP